VAGLKQRSALGGHGAQSLQRAGIRLVGYLGRRDIFAIWAVEAKTIAATISIWQRLEKPSFARQIIARPVRDLAKQSRRLNVGAKAK
jgi:hypothetical protein